MMTGGSWNSFHYLDRSNFLYKEVSKHMCTNMYINKKTPENAQVIESFYSTFYFVTLFSV